MNEEWKYVNFGDVLPIRMGKTPARADLSMWDKEKTTNNKWVAVADITKNEGGDINSTAEHISDTAAKKMKLVEKGSLLMSFKLTIGKMAFAGDNLYTNEAIIAIPENDKYDLKFLYFYLSSYPWNTLTEGSEKVKGKTLNKTSIGKILLPIISLEEQKNIVNILQKGLFPIDALKTNAEKQLQAANDLKQALLKKVFEEDG